MCYFQLKYSKVILFPIKFVAALENLVIFIVIIIVARKINKLYRVSFAR